MMSGIAAAELNFDGHIDVVTANNDGADATVLLGRGDGTFTVGRRIATGSGFPTLALLDLTGDGAPDLVTAEGTRLRVYLHR